ncbi:CatB-related O-acetyltransferase [Flaviramulus sp. BrNp1-15]|nr:CatB-related O-acetyltransferase [Flaviramulus sp. BrNp1-15]ULC58269.1 CatB-related O-acetyltransferase [Flaviramulus sp. BrNp1-15]
MIYQLRVLFWRILGVDYNHTLKIHDYVFLKKDNYTKIGHKTYDNGALVWRWTEAKLIIGKYCSIANNVKFIIDEGYHKASQITSFPLIDNIFKERKTLPSGKDKIKFLKKIKQREGITIGNDVWIGMGAFIMPGVNIGNGVTIAANSVVTKNIPDYSIVAGVPAKIIKKKFDDKTIQNLNEIAWWDWDIKTLEDRIEEFYGDPLDFVEKYKIK